MKLNEKTNFENDYDSNKFQLINSWLLLKHWENLYQSNGTVYYSIKLCTYKIWVEFEFNVELEIMKIWCAVKILLICIELTVYSWSLVNVYPLNYQTLK
jgi:hypothetical protein